MIKRQNSSGSGFRGFQRALGHLSGVSILVASLSGCASLGGTGPSTRAVLNADKLDVGQAGIQIVDLDYAATRRLLAANRTALLSEVLGDAPLQGTVIGTGDVLEVAIWEAPPAMLFGAGSPLGGASAGSLGGSGSQRSTFPELTVDANGSILIPFGGPIAAAGRTPAQIERAIVRSLAGKAHRPQAGVRLVRNASANVTVVGEVATNGRIPVSPRGERLLDVLAAAGGVKQATDKMTIQVTRGDRVASLPLDRVIRDPVQNIRMAADDVVTALYQPFSFTSLGATGTSAEIPFEATGMSLAEALGRVGGLKDDRADVSGVFLFRLEDPAAMDPAIAATARRTPDGRVPVIYRADLKNPANMFVAQSFPVRDKDVIYVSSAQISDLQRFVSMIASTAFPVIGLTQTVR